DEIADLAPDLSEEVVQDIIEAQDVEDRAELQSALSYPEGTVGALMDFDVVSIRDDVTVEVALRYLRRYDELPAQTDAIFILDREARGACRADADRGRHRRQRRKPDHHPDRSRAGARPGAARERTPTVAARAGGGDDERRDLGQRPRLRRLASLPQRRPGRRD